MRERGREKGGERQTVRQTEAESVRDGHVRFPAPQLAPLHTNTEPEMNLNEGLVSQTTVNMNFGFVWQLTMKHQGSLHDKRHQGTSSNKIILKNMVRIACLVCINTRCPVDNKIVMQSIIWIVCYILYVCC